MIKPEQFVPRPNLIRNGQARIEAAVDGKLAEGILTIDGGRSGWLSDDVAAVADKYRAAGWTVATPDGFTFVFSAP